MSGAYYNEFDPFAAEWLRTMMLYGEIAQGDVDERSIEDVTPDDLKGYTQCHFFAGIGVWSYALRTAGWPDDRPIWTGSCPCQPFSQAGKGLGFADERHLWPALFHLIRQRRPVRILGEQVEGKDGYPWLDLIFSDLEGEDYACGAVPYAAAGVGATDQRHRLYWLANNNMQRPYGPAGRAEQDRSAGPSHRGAVRRLADQSSDRWEQRRENTRGLDSRGAQKGLSARLTGSSSFRGLGDDDGARLSNAEFEELCRQGRGPQGAAAEQPGRSFWSGAEWLWCRDSKFRPVEPGTFPLDHGSPGRVGALRGYGGALNAEAAIAFVQSSLEVLG